MNGQERSELSVLTAEVRVLQTQVARLIDREETRIKREEDLERRMRSVEKWKYSVPFGVLVGLATFIGSLLGRGI